MSGWRAADPSPGGVVVAVWVLALWFALLALVYDSSGMLVAAALTGVVAAVAHLWLLDRP